jgi:hypothetical protein
MLASLTEHGKERDDQGKTRKKEEQTKKEIQKLTQEAKRREKYLEILQCSIFWGWSRH